MDSFDILSLGLNMKTSFQDSRSSNTKEVTAK